MNYNFLQVFGLVWHRVRKRVIVSLGLSAVLLLSACSSTSRLVSWLTPYRVDVRQGNYVSKDMAAQLKPGLTRDQVRFVLGTPLIKDVFHGDRWDYIYRFKAGNGKAEERHLTVFFAGGKLARVEGDVSGVTSSTVGAAAADENKRVIEIAPEEKKTRDPRRGVVPPPQTVEGPASE